MTEKKGSNNDPKMVLCHDVRGNNPAAWQQRKVKYGLTLPILPSRCLDSPETWAYILENGRTSRQSDQWRFREDPCIGPDQILHKDPTKKSILSKGEEANTHQKRSFNQNIPWQHPREHALCIPRKWHQDWKEAKGKSKCKTDQAV
jgi:hypothetical protein